MDPLAEIRQIYFQASRATISRDFDRAIDLLKSMGREEDRERATVFMDGLAEMRAEWDKAGPVATPAGKGRRTGTAKATGTAGPSAKARPRRRS